MGNDRKILLQVAEAVADGAPVNWEEESQEHVSLKQPLDRLRELEAIGVAHRSLGEQEGGRDVPGQAGVAGQSESDSQSTQSLDVQPEPLQKWGALRIVEKLGEGGFGEVYRAHDLVLQQDVALKLPRADRYRGDATRRFLDEARRLAKVRHPNVLVIHGAEEHDGRMGLWTDLLEGQTLEDLLQGQGPFGAQEAALIGIELCRAVAAVHGAGLIHRDIKTANIMRERGGRHVLMDFSAVIDKEPGLDSVRDLSLSGTPHFMAPELFRGESATAVSDIYSLGVVLYRLVTGRFPVQAANIHELRDKHARGVSVPLLDARPDLPEFFVEVVEKALAADPGRRYASAGEMQSALRGLAPGQHPGSTPTPKPTPWWQKPALTLPLAAILILAAVLVVILIPVSGPVPLDVEIDLFRLREGSEERLVPGGVIRPGDQLFLEINGSGAMHVYVFNEDNAGVPTVLFPLGDLDTANPLYADTTHRLPGHVNGVEQYWDVTSAGGKETILVIASHTPLVGLEQRMEQLPKAGADFPYEIPRADLEKTLRGISGLSPGRLPDETGASGQSLSEIFNQLSREAAGTSGVRFWEIRLENPGVP